MKTIIKSISVLLITAVVFTSCKKEPVQVTPLPQPLAYCSNPPYDLDITLNTTYKFLDNVSDPYGYAPVPDYDLTEIIGKAIIFPLGEYDIYVGELADTATLSDKLYYNNIKISKGIYEASYIIGNSSINFKKLIRQGGGAFNGTLAITRGSAQYCNSNIFSSLPPLMLTGTLDVNTHLVNLRIKGKTYF